MSGNDIVAIENPNPNLLEPYGWVLGKPFPLTSDRGSYRSPASDFWHQHAFDPGEGGETEILWVNYRDNSPLVAKLEVHRLTQQAVVPLTKAIVQILCLSHPDRSPNLATLRAFRLSPGVGFCMRPGIWHTTRADDATCLMLTRRSTTKDLVAHLVDKRPAKESASASIPQVCLRVTGAE